MNGEKKFQLMTILKYKHGSTVACIRKANTIIIYNVGIVFFAQQILALLITTLAS